MEVQVLQLFVALLLSLVLYPVWIWFVYRFHMMHQERADGPHPDKTGTPTMGGLVFLVVVAVMTLLFNRSRTQSLFPIFVICLSGCFGLLEDFGKSYRKSGLPGFFRYHFYSFFGKVPVVSSIWRGFREFWRVVGSSTEGGLETHNKFLIQAMIAGFVSVWTYVKLGWDFIWFPLIGDVHIGILYPIITFFGFIAVINFVAFSDGLDGLAGGLSLYVFCAFWVISFALGYNSLATFCAVFVGALLPFLYFNVFPARVFMGNVGSYTLAATMAMLAIVTHREIAFLVIGAVLLLDGISSPIQSVVYKVTKKRIFRMAPIHHHFEKLEWPVPKVVFRFWLFGIAVAFAGIFVALL